MSKTLHAIQLEYMELQDKLIQNEGQLTEEEFEKLWQVEKDGAAKMKAMYFVYLNLEAQKAPLQAIIDNVKATVEMYENKLKALSKSQESIVDRCDSYFKQVGKRPETREDHKVKKVAMNDGGATWKYRLGTEKNILDETKVPAEFFVDRAPVIEKTELYKWAENNPDKAKGIVEIKPKFTLKPDIPKKK